MTSVTANFNENFANAQPSDYTQHFSDNIVIPPNSKVALYQAELTKKPIAISEGDTVTVVLDVSDSEHATVYTVAAANVSTTANPFEGATTPSNLVLNVDLSGRNPYFSKSEFLAFFAKQLNDAILNYNDHETNGEYTRFFYLPYRAVTHDFKDSVFVSLSRDRFITDISVNNLPYYVPTAGSGDDLGLPPFNFNMLATGSSIGPRYLYQTDGNNHIHNYIFA